MSILRALAVAALAFAGVGCVDPSLYKAPAAPVGGVVMPNGTPAAPTGVPAPAQPRGHVRIPAAQPTNPLVNTNNIAISIEKVGVSAATAREAALAFRYANDDVVVRGGGGLARRNGIRIGVATGDLRVGLSANERRTRHTSRDTMFIVVANGAEGQIAMGSDAYVGRLAYWTPRGYRVLLERQFVGRSLVVRPRIVGSGMVEVELWPRFTARGRRGAIDVTELATKVVVRSGQSIVIGGMTSGSEDVGAVLFGVGARQRTHTMSIILTPTIGGAAIEWPGSRR